MAFHRSLVSPNPEYYLMTKTAAADLNSQFASRIPRRVRAAFMIKPDETERWGIFIWNELKEDFERFDGAEHRVFDDPHAACQFLMRRKGWFIERRMDMSPTVQAAYMKEAS